MNNRFTILHLQFNLKRYLQKLSLYVFTNDRLKM